MTPEALLSLVRLSDPQLSPDGKFVLYGVSYTSIEENRSCRNLFLTCLEDTATFRQGDRIQLTADGQDGYQAYQITDADQPVGPTDSLKNNASVYYIENRQKQGWDSYLPGHGLIAWKVNYSKTAWQENTPNSEDRKPRFTVAQVSGSWNKIAAKPLKDITEKNGVVSLVYISEPPFKVTWMANGEVLEVAEYAADGSQVLVAPKNEVVPCEDGTMLAGWTVLYPNWADPFDFPPDMDKCFGEKVTEDLTIHAVFSEIPIPCCEE